MDDLRAVRREIYKLKNACIDLAFDVQDANPEAAQSIQRARNALFEAWTLLCSQHEDEDDH